MSGIHATCGLPAGARTASSCSAPIATGSKCCTRRPAFPTSGAPVALAATKYPALATIVDFIGRDGHVRSHAEHRVIEVETVSLNDLLVAHGAPRDVDFISIGTEGSEYEILEAFDFQRWNVLLFSVEHNRTGNEQKIEALMRRNGYRRRYSTYPIFDAWYRRIES